jgi:hypothetical protein
MTRRFDAFDNAITRRFDAAQSQVRQRLDCRMRWLMTLLIVRFLAILGNMLRDFLR